MNLGAKNLSRQYFLPYLFLLILSLLRWDIAFSENATSAKEGKKGHPKIESGLFDLKEKYLLEGKVGAGDLVGRRKIRIDGEDKIVIFILPEKGKTKEAIDLEGLKQYGGEVLKSGDYVVKARVPISMIESVVERVKGISFVKLPDRPYADVVPEGVALTGASVYHASGYVGQNVKAAIIDLGFAGVGEAVSAGALPSSAVRIDCTGTNCAPTDFSSEVDERHGTAVAEIVYAMAPGAQLYLIKIDDNLDLMDAKDYCIVNGIKIINHSVGWFNSNFYDGNCYFDNAVCSANHAYKNGILWANSAGNHGRRHYEAVFQDMDGDRLHNVTSGNNFITLQADAGDPIIVTLTWDAWPATDQDYDLLLLNSSFQIVAAGVNLQDGSQPPEESLGYLAQAAGTYYLAVKNYKTSANHRMKIFTFYHDLNPHVASSSLLSPADATGVMAVAAIDWRDWLTGPQEDFSSQGPTSDGRMKPEISGPDGVTSFTYSPDFFFGTSAASPHVAGAAALILSNSPELTVSQLWDALTFSAIDMGEAGQDTIYGYGRLNLSGIYIYPTSVDFGKTLVGTASQRTVVVQNVGTQNLVIGTIGSPGFPYQIGQDNCSGRTLALGESCTLVTRFSPTGTGEFQGDFVIPSNDPYLNSVTVTLHGEGVFEVTLFSPLDGESFNSCSLLNPPIFWWEAFLSFQSYEIQFSADPLFFSIPVEIKVVGTNPEKLLTRSQWKKVMRLSGPEGGVVYWRVVGTQGDGTPFVSDTRLFFITEPRPVEDLTISPTSRHELPTLTWQNNCNVKFKAWFGRDLAFSKKKVLNFVLSDSNLSDGAFLTQLTEEQWMKIRQLVDDQAGSTLYWFVESRDRLNRETTSEVMSFDLVN